MNESELRQSEMGIADGRLTPAVLRTALDQILARESGEEATCERADALAAFLAFLFKDNPDDPVLVMRRLYSLVYEFRPDLLRCMTQKRIGLYLGLTKQGFSKLIIRRQEKQGTRKHGRMQKPYSSRESYRRKAHKQHHGKDGAA